MLYDPRTRLTGSPLGAIVSAWTRLSPVKAVQRGTVTLGAGVGSNTLTINSVDLNHCIVRLVSGDYTLNTDNEDSLNVLLTPTNGTTMTVTRTNTLGGVVATVEITEYYPGTIRSMNRGTIVANGTASIAAVVLAKAELSSLGLTTDAGVGAVARSRGTLVQTNTTTVTGSRQDNAATCTIGFQTAERW